MTRTARFRTYLQRLLVDLCRIDTTPKTNVAQMRAAEKACFAILERELKALHFSNASCRRVPIDPAIKNHPSFSLLHFTKSPRHPEGLSPEETYAGRSNLVYIAPGSERKRRGESVALNAHIDVVAPYFAPRVTLGIVHGRGACDDKGPVVSMIGALAALSEVMARAGLEWNRNVVAMFVVEEETGGNGSLSLALDRQLKELYDSILVGECTGLKIHPANRGAVWYQIELTTPARGSAFELFALVNEELEKEGAAIRAESRHPLFPQRPVQTCHGIIGPFGEHPSRICAEASFLIQFARRPGADIEMRVRDCLDSGLAAYIDLYGDKTKALDPATGKPMVTRHYDCKRAGFGFRIDVHGATGHMGAIRERDGAITKMAHLARSLIVSKTKLAAKGGPVRLELAGQSGDRTLTLEGGQGFLPTHGIAEIMERLRRAAQRGASGAAVKVTFDKLHNAAFDGDPKSNAMRQAIAAAKASGIWKNEPILGWTVSCDARLFAAEYPGMPVLTFGPGELARAHSDQEQIKLSDAQKAAEFLALFLLRQTGTIT
ncbi:MAG TPA: M20/M25/M40 family metallo-hydrolase [Candidatus Saccharimonadales bacterium]|nr:M20/M25/M40 family metallo-hydrolase [Candidatus Saccharimonadales bacterium]